MNAIEIALIDDMGTDQEKIEMLLNDYAAIHSLCFRIKSFSSAEEFFSVFQPYRFSIIFLDIYMEGMSGIEAAKQIRESDDIVNIIFLTGSEDHRAEAFQQFASAYIVKPADDKIIFRTMDHLLHERTELEEKRFFFISERKETSLPYSKIISLRTEGNYIIITDTDNCRHRTRMLFSDAEKVILRDSRFLAINRGVIVNLDHVLIITDDLCRLSAGITYPIHRKKGKDIQKIWHNYNFEKLRRENFHPGGLP